MTCLTQLVLWPGPLNSILGVLEMITRLSEHLVLVAVQQNICRGDYNPPMTYCNTTRTYV